MSDPIGGSKTYTQYRQDIINQYGQARGNKHLRFSEGKQLYVHSGWKPSRIGYGAADRLEKRQKAAEELKQSINREFQQLAPNVGDKVFKHLQERGHDFSTRGIKLNEQWRIDQAISDVLRSEANKIDSNHPRDHVSSQDQQRADNLRTVAGRFEAVAKESSHPKQAWTHNKGTGEHKRLLRSWARLIGQANLFKAAIAADYGQDTANHIENHLYIDKSSDIYKGIGFDTIAHAKEELRNIHPDKQPVRLNVFQQAKEASLKQQALNPMLSQAEKTIKNTHNDVPRRQDALNYLQEHKAIAQELKAYRQSGMQDLARGAQLAQRLRKNIAHGASILQDMENRFANSDRQNPPKAMISLREHLRAANELLLAHAPPQDRNLNRPPTQSLQALQASNQHQALADAANAVNYYNKPIVGFGSQVEPRVLHQLYQGQSDQFRKVARNYQNAIAEVQELSQAFKANPSDENLANLSAAVDKAGRASDRFLLMLDRANRHLNKENKPDDLSKQSYKAWRQETTAALPVLQDMVMEQRKSLQKLGWHASNINDIRNHLATGLLQNQNFLIAPQHQQTGDAHAASQRNMDIELAQFVHSQPKMAVNQPGQRNVDPLPPPPPFVDEAKIHRNATQGDDDIVQAINTVRDDYDEIDVNANDEGKIQGNAIQGDDDIVQAINTVRDGDDDIVQAINTARDDYGEIDVDANDEIIIGDDDDDHLDDNESDTSGIGKKPQVNEESHEREGIETIDVNDDNYKLHGPDAQNEVDGNNTLKEHDDEEMYGLDQEDQLAAKETDSGHKD